MKSYLHIVTALTLTAITFLGLYITNLLPHWHVLATFWGVAGAIFFIIVLPYLHSLHNHHTWLLKNEKQQHRDTDVLVPPHGLKPIYKTLQTSNDPQQDNSKHLDVFIRSYRQKGQWRIALIFGVIAVLLSLHVSLQFDFLFNILRDTVNLTDKDIHLSNFTTRQTFLVVFLSVLNLAVWGDCLFKNTSQNISLIANTSPQQGFLQQNRLILLTLIITSLAFGGLLVRDALLNKQNAAQKTVQQIEAKAKKLEKEQQILVERKNFLAKENAALLRTLEKNKSKISLLEDKPKALHNKLEDHKSKIKTLQNALAEKKQEISQFESKINNLKKQRQADQKEREEHANKIDTLKSSLKKLKAQQKQTDKKLKSARERLDVTKGTIKAIEDEHMTTKANLEKWQASFSFKKALEESETFEKIAALDDVKLVKNNTILRINAPALFSAKKEDRLNSDAQTLLKPVAKALEKILSKHPQAWVVVQGHSNALPIQNSDYQSKLSLTAVQASLIKRVLNDLAVAPILATGFGYQKEIDSRLSKSALQKNNRIDIMIMLLPI